MDRLDVLGYDQPELVIEVQETGYSTEAREARQTWLKLFIDGLLGSLPPEGEWTRRRRDQFIGALGAALDWKIRVVEEE